MQIDYTDPFAAQQAQAQASLQAAQQAKQYRTPQGPGMVGRVYVGAHPLQGLAEVLRTRQAANQEEDAMKQLQGIGQQRQTESNRVSDAMLGALRGTPAMPENAPQPDYQGNAVGPTMPAQPAKAGSMMDAYKVAANSQLPEYQRMGREGMMKQSQDQMAKQRDEQIWAASGGDARKALQLGMDANKVKIYSELGGDMTKDLLVRDAQGNLVPNTALIDIKRSITKAGAPVVDARSYNTQESEQSKTYGKTLGEIRGNITQAGYEAPKQLAKLDRMEELLKGVDGGAAAPTLAQISSTANSLGIKLDKNLGPKEAAVALAVNMATGMRQPGTGPMTDKDFDNFLKQVPDLSKSAEGRKQIMTTMRASIQRDLEAAKFAREYAKRNNGVVDDNFFDSMADFYAKNPVVNIPMPETNSRGGQFRVVR